MYILEPKLALSAQSGLIVAISTVYRSTFAGFERHFGFFSTISACYGEHLPLRPVTVATPRTLRLPCLTTWKTALRLVSIASRGEELLLLGTKSEGSPTI